MPRKTISFELDFIIKDIISKFTVKQFDDVTFNITPLMNNVPYTTTNMTGVIYIGCDNDLFQQNADIVVSNNNINIKLNKTMLQNCGRAYAELELKDSNGTVTSSTFLFNIEKKIGEGSTIPGSIEGFVAKYERLISEFKSQVNLTINNCNNKVNSTINNCNANVDNKLNTVDNLINTKISDFEKRFNRLTSSQQQDAEAIDARTDFKGVVFDSLKERIDYTDKLLRDSTVSTVETESDFTTVEATSNGYFEDVKLEGKTLVNLADRTRYTPTIGGWKTNLGNTELYKTNTTYTFIGDVTTLADGVGLYINGETLRKGHNMVTFTTGDTTNDITIYSVGTPGTFAIDNALILEGDHTQNPPSYFEGLASVGDTTDEIVVSSVKGDGNLVIDANINLYIPQNNAKVEKTTEGIRAYNRITGDDRVFLQPFRVRQGSKVTISFDVKVDTEGSSTLFYLSFLDANFNRIITTNFPTKTYTTSFERITKTFDVGNASYIRIELVSFGASAGATYKNIMVSNHSKPYVPYQSDKKRLLYYNNETQAWEKPILRQWDSTEKHTNGKYYYHQRSGEVVLNGSEEWHYPESQAGDTTILLYSRISDSKINQSYPICDMFNGTYLNIWEPTNDIEGMFINHNKDCILRVNKAKLPTQDVEGFKQWLQANNVTVVYQLAQEKVYECTNIDLITYNGETNYIVESGALSPKTTLKVHNNISNVVSLLQKKVSLLESDITSYMITQNRLMLASRYNADTVSFKVDVATLRNSFEYDNDLYELILNNILVGKDNYNREYIENLIIFYWMDFVISDEMHSTLFEIIEEQHNPKVIEEETPLI